MDQSEGQEEQILVFKTIENLFGPLVPDIKNALSWSGYDNFIILANLKEGHIQKIEQQFKRKTNRDFLPGYSDTLVALSAEIKMYGISCLAQLVRDTKTDSAASTPALKPSRKTFRPDVDNDAAPMAPPDVETLKRAVAEQVKRQQLMNDCLSSDIIVYQAPETEGGSYSVQCPMCPTKINIGITRGQRSSRWIPSNIYAHLKTIHGNGGKSSGGHLSGVNLLDHDDKKRKRDSEDDENGEHQYFIKEEYVVC